MRDQRGITGLEVLGIIFLVGLSLRLSLWAGGKRQECKWVESKEEQEAPGSQARERTAQELAGLCGDPNRKGPVPWEYLR